jgi:D-glycero-D-manno-heptose 1,7-bisphosphate phosphatase
VIIYGRGEQRIGSADAASEGAVGGADLSVRPLLRVAELLEAEGAALLDSFVCPHHEQFTGPCACRKPGTLLFERAAALYDLDLSRSMFAGDKHRDVAPAVGYGAPAYLVRSPDTPEEHVERARAEGAEIVDTLLDAARRFLGRTP